ncbi:unnamed protein product [Ambrosiozyma monospora]|uniref:Unnamed protein product n=1 Tax=Ambrosiozyma monospora TaxID=43982 RepID=A0A9W7DHF7_AMBMO|nr:unnamed protein product [Ambrosiozyma monospora]
MTGLVTHEKFGCKCMKWHINKNYVASISNGAGAVCAGKLLQHSSGHEQEAYYNYAKSCVNFLLEHMQDDDGFIMDGVGLDSDSINRMKWSYNTGTCLSAICLLYKHDHDEQWVNKAKTLAEAATHRGKFIFDRDYGDWNKRFWWGPSYFIQHLIEGLADYLEIMGDKAPESTRNCCKNEVLRHLSYFRKYCYDQNDGLYFMSFDIYKLSSEIFTRYKDQFGGHKTHDPSHEDRMGGMDNVDVKDRPMCKCLIGAASAARIFFQGARVQAKMDPVDV